MRSLRGSDGAIMSIHVHRGYPLLALHRAGFDAQEADSRAGTAAVYCAYPDRRSPMKLDADTCWTAVQERDASKDGAFVYGVLTTGVYCRPSCASRRALRKNVRFFATPAEAERAGLRACLRCRPNTDHTQDAIDARVAKACELITRNVEQPLALKQLAA